MLDMNFSKSVHYLSFVEAANLAHRNINFKNDPKEEQHRMPDLDI
jgi:hypothetical protein